MKKIKNMLILFLLIFCIANAENQTIWGINNNDINIETGCIISDVNMKIGNGCKIYIIDNPDSGIENYTKEIFDPNTFPYGAYLCNSSDFDGNIQFLSINDPNSHFWNIFETPFLVTFGDGQQVNYSSSVLNFVDYAGTGRSVGFFIFGNFNKASVDIKVKNLSTGEEMDDIIFDVNLLYKFFDNWLCEVDGWPDYNGDGIVNLIDWGYFSKNYSP